MTSCSFWILHQQHTETSRESKNEYFTSPNAWKMKMLHIVVCNFIKQWEPSNKGSIQLTNNIIQRHIYIQCSSNFGFHRSVCNEVRKVGEQFSGHGRETTQTSNSNTHWCHNVTGVQKVILLFYLWFNANYANKNAVSTWTENKSSVKCGN
jgi:hypothetical protein